MRKTVAFTLLVVVLMLQGATLSFGQEGKSKQTAGTKRKATSPASASSASSSTPSVMRSFSVSHIEKKQKNPTGHPLGVSQGDDEGFDPVVSLSQEQISIPKTSLSVENFEGERDRFLHLVAKHRLRLKPQVITLQTKEGRVASYQFTDLFTVDQSGRIACLMQVEREGVKHTRLVYRSSSQGVFRVLPATNHGVQGVPGFDKGIHETTLDLPRELQKHLAQKIVAKEFQRNCSQEEGMEILKASVKKNESQKNWSEHYEALKAQFSRSKIFARTQSQNLNSYHFTDDENAPHFNVLVDSYFSEVATVGRVEALVYRSKNGRIEYTLFRELKEPGRVWVASAADRDSEINSFGVFSSAVDIGPFGTPLWEYKNQTIAALRGSQNPLHPCYTNYWRYLKRLTLIEDWYRVMNTVIPASQSQQLEDPSSQASTQPL